MGIPIGHKQQVSLMTADYGRGRMTRAAIVALVSFGLPSMPLPAAMDEWKGWLVGLTATIAALLTTKTSK